MQPVSDLPENPYQPPGDYLREEEQGESGETVSAEERVRLDVGEVFRQGWTLFLSRRRLCAGSWLLTMVLFFGCVPVIAIFDVYYARDRWSALPFVGLVFLWFLLLWLHIGVALICLKIARGDRVSIVTLFSGIRYVANILATGLVFLFCFEFGLIFLIVPGILFASAFSQAFYLILDNRESTVAGAFSASMRITEQNRWPLFGILGRLLLLALPIVIPFAGVLYSLRMFRSRISLWRWSICG